MNRQIRCAFAALSLVTTLATNKVAAQKDTLRVMGYNALYYGSGCQGPNGLYHGYLKTIVSFTNPDILSLEKMGAIRATPDDKYGTAPVGFADSIVKYALDAAFPGRYAHCPYTNASRTNNMSVIFYDQRKLGFVAMVSSYSNITDFNTYKLYYKDPNLAETHDTTFLYVIPNHDMSGDEFEQVRGGQIAEVMRHTREHFKHLPNMINLGDFNVRGSDEMFYQTLTNPSDTNFRFFDPPFFPDGKLRYPANWDHDPKFAAYFTTSTRESADIPNSCGTGGGGKNWYDHIFLSSWIVNNANYIRYIPNSYRTIGNDGQRYQVSINNRNGHVNTSAPADVIEALYQMSNKYPVMVDLEVTSNTGGRSLADPEIAGGQFLYKSAVLVDPVIDGKLSIHFPADVTGQEVTIECLVNDDAQMKKIITVKDKDTKVKCNLKAGTYTLKMTGHHNVLYEESLIIH